VLVIPHPEPLVPGTGTRPLRPGCLCGTSPACPGPAGERAPHGRVEGPPMRVDPPASLAAKSPAQLPKLAPFLCTRRNSYTRKDFKSFGFSTYRQFLMLLKTMDFKPFRISRSTIFARNPFGFSTYIKTPGGRGEEYLPSYPTTLAAPKCPPKPWRRRKPWAWATSVLCESRLPRVRGLGRKGGPLNTVSSFLASPEFPGRPQVTRFEPRATRRGQRVTIPARLSLPFGEAFVSVENSRRT
jgi:hypothetical protein